MSEPDSDQASKAASDSDMEQASKPTRSPVKSFRILPVAAIVLPAALLIGAIVVFFGFLEGAEILADLRKPPLLPATGTVTFNGSPLAGAEIWSQPEIPGLRGARGLSDEKGRFVFKTEIQGTFVDGIYAGRHKITVMKRGTGAGASAPPLLTPEQYLSFETTPFTFHVERPPAKNELSLELEGEAPAQGGPSRPLPTRGGAPENGGGSFGGQGRGRGPGPRRPSAEEPAEAAPRTPPVNGEERQGKDASDNRATE